MDVRGFGETSARWDDYSAHAVGRDALALIEHLKAGSAVILGHVDNSTGPGVFFQLRTLAPGDQVYVALADGDTRFVKRAISPATLKAAITRAGGEVVGADQY